MTLDCLLNLFLTTLFLYLDEFATDLRSYLANSISLSRSVSNIFVDCVLSMTFASSSFFYFFTYFLLGLISIISCVLRSGEFSMNMRF